MIQIDPIGTLYAALPPDAPEGTQPAALPGWHVNTTHRVAGWDEYRVAPKTPRRVFGGIPTVFYAFPDKASFDAALASADLSNHIDELLAAAKAARADQIAAITVTTSGGNVFDGDERSQDRMSRALAAMDDADTLPWVLADNSVAVVGRSELREALRLAGAEMAAIWVGVYTIQDDQI